MLPIMDVSRWQGNIDWDKVKASVLVSGVMRRTKRTLRKSHSKEDIMASTTYRYLGDVTEMFAAQEQFRDITKMVCARFRDLTKTYHLGNANQMVTFCHRFAVIGNMVRNAGQLPQPFWLGAACGGGSCSAARCAART